MHHYSFPVIIKNECLKPKRTSHGVFLEDGDAEP